MSRAAPEPAAPRPALQVRVEPAVRPHLRVGWLQLVALGAALIVAFEFVHPIAWGQPRLRATVETTMTLLALAGASLVRDRFIRTRHLRSLLLLGALLTLAITEFVANALPSALLARPASGLTAVLPLGQLVVAGMFAAVALAPSDTFVTAGKRPALTLAVSSLVAVALAELIGLLLRDKLLAGASGHGHGFDRVLLHPVGFLVLLITTGLFVFAGTRLARRGRVEGNRALTLLAAGPILLAAARVYYLATPSVAPEFVTLREALRLVAFAVIFTAAVLGSLELRRTLTQAAAISERRRVAQDLHDGIAQDLALIAAHSGHMSNELGGEHPVVMAATHALAVTRGTISELSYAASGSAEEALEAVADELRHRFGIQIRAEVGADGELSPKARDHLARIAREAIANAVRHGDARRVTLILRQTSAGFSLRVRDDGGGLVDASGASLPEGFGLRSMRQRATALGGSLSVFSASGGGTEVEVTFPS